jgi:hypothetical protein
VLPKKTPQAVAKGEDKESPGRVPNSLSSSSLPLWLFSSGWGTEFPHPILAPRQRLVEESDRKMASIAIP